MNSEPIHHPNKEEESAGLLSAIWEESRLAPSIPTEKYQFAELALEVDIQTAILAETTEEWHEVVDLFNSGQIDVAAAKYEGSPILNEVVNLYRNRPNAA